jgi:uncharacterized membrane protein
MTTPNSGVPDVQERRARVAEHSMAVRAIKAQHAASATLFEHLSDQIAKSAGSTPFLLFHVVWFGAWIAWNTGLMPFRPFDPFPLGLLTLVVSLEAIFLSIFILIAQNRESGIGELREETTLAVNLRMEAEVTKSLQLIAGLYTRLGYQIGQDKELQEMLKPLDAQSIENDLMEQLARAGKRKRSRSGQGPRYTK